jgi:hypothetical protein
MKAMSLPKSTKKKLCVKESAAESKHPPKKDVLGGVLPV